MKVPLNFIICQTFGSHSAISQYSVVARVGAEVEDRPGECHPDLPPPPVGNPLGHQPGGLQGPVHGDASAVFSSMLLPGDLLAGLSGTVHLDGQIYVELVFEVNWS